MEVITIKSRAYQDILSKLDALYSHFRAIKEMRNKAEVESENVWMDCKSVCDFLSISQRTLLEGYIKYSLYSDYEGRVCSECGQRGTHSAKESATGLHDFRRFRFLSSLLRIFSLMDGFRYKTERTGNTIYVWMSRAGNVQHANVQLDDPNDFCNMIQKMIIVIIFHKVIYGSKSKKLKLCRLQAISMTESSKQNLLYLKRSLTI